MSVHHATDREIADRVGRACKRLRISIDEYIDRYLSGTISPAERRRWSRIRTLVR